MTPVKFDCYSPSLLEKSSINASVNLILAYLSAPKVSQSTVTPKGTSMALEDYSYVIWLKSIHYFQGTGQETEWHAFRVGDIKISNYNLCFSGPHMYWMQDFFN